MNPTAKNGTSLESPSFKSQFHSLIEWVAKIQAEFVNNIPGFLVLLLDAEKKIRFINEFTCKMLGVSQDEAMNSNWFQEYLLHPEADIYEKKFEEAFHGGIMEQNMECFLIAKNGTKYIVRWNVEVLRDPQRKVVGIYCLGQDVTEKRTMRMELNHRIAMEQLITEISTTFLNIDPIDFCAKIQGSLANIGVFTNADRSYLFQYDAQEEFFHLSAIWRADGLNSSESLGKIIPIKEFPTLYEQLARGDIINLSSTKNISRFAAIERFFLQNNGIKSFLSVPIIKKDKIYGFLGLDMLSGNKIWNKLEIHLLKTIANILVKVFIEEDLLREKDKLEKMFEKAFYSNQTSMAIHNRENNKMITVNRNFSNAVGLSQDEIIGRTFMEIDPLVSLEDVSIISNQLSKTGRISMVPLPFKSGSGEKRMGLFSMEVFSSYGDEYVLSSIVDITDQKRLENEINIFKCLIDTSDLGFVLYTLEGEITYFNSAIMRLVEAKSRQELMGRNIHDFYSKDYKKIVRNEIIPLVMKEGQWMGEAQAKTLTNQFKPTFQNIFLVSENADSTTFVANIIQDISEQKDIEKILINSEERYRTLAEKFPLPLGISDEKGNHIYLNPAFTREFGYTLEDIPNTDAWMVLAYPEDSYRKSVYDYWTNVKAGNQKPQPKEIVCKDGTKKHVKFREFTLSHDELVSVVEILD